MDIDDTWSDKKIWKYAKERSLIIITKATDFYNRIIISDPPPKVIHLRIGNMRTKQLLEFICGIWGDVISLTETCKLVTVYSDRIEGLKNPS